MGRKAAGNADAMFEYANYVQDELPKRLARRLMDLQFLPYIVVTNPHIKRVYDAYRYSFQVLLDCKRVTTPTEIDDLSKLLQKHVEDHTPMLDVLACGVYECRNKPVVGERLQLDSFLDNMLRSRVSRRVIAEHYINLHIGRPGFIGCIKTHLSIYSALEHAINRARLICSEIYGKSPRVLTLGNLEVGIPYIPAHIDYILFELLKNSMRAIIDSARGHSYGQSLPPIQACVCEARDEVTIRISDQGGGVEYDSMSKIWEYGYTSIQKEDKADDSGLLNPLGIGHAPQYKIGGLGFGLPLSRLHARYFGGDLELISMPGYGMDAFLKLRRLEDHQWMEAID